MTECMIYFQQLSKSEKEFAKDSCREENLETAKPSLNIAWLYHNSLNGTPLIEHFEGKLVYGVN
jgi:hypothetical protein